MPTIFSFQQGSESRARQNEESPLLGRFRAVPADEGRIRRRSSARGWFSSFRSGSWKYATVNVSDDSDDEENGLQERSRFGRLRKLLLVPEQSSVREAVEHWWGRWLLLYILPALIVSTLLVPYFLSFVDSMD